MTSWLKLIYNRMILASNFSGVLELWSLLLMNSAFTAISYGICNLFHFLYFLLRRWCKLFGLISVCIFDCCTCGHKIEIWQTHSFILVVNIVGIVKNYPLLNNKYGILFSWNKIPNRASVMYKWTMREANCLVGKLRGCFIVPDSPYYM